MIVEFFPQDELLNLACRCMRNLVHEYDVVRHPPFGDFAVEIFQHVRFRQVLAGLQHEDQKRPLIPFGWRTPITAASATDGCPTAMFSISMDEIHSPPDLITSLARSVIVM